MTIQRSSATTRLLVTLGWLWLLGTLAGCRPDERIGRQQPRAQAGVLDLRGWDPARDGPAELRGEWRFEWQTLRDPSGEPTANATFMELPATWNGYRLDGVELGATGYATYSLTVLLDDRQQGLSLYLPRVRTASALWVNGLEVARMGSPGSDAGSSSPLRRDTVVAIETDARLELLLQVSNFHFRTGGADKALVLGRTQQQLAPIFGGALASIFFIGCFVMLGSYHLVLFATRRGNPAPAVFGSLCFLVAVYVLTRENEIFGELLPHLPWQTELRLEYSLFALIVPSTTFFFRLIYPREAGRRLVLWSGTISTLFLVSVWTLPTLLLSTWPLLAFQALFAATGLYGAQRLWVVLRRGRPGSGWFLLGFLAFLLTGFADALLARLVPESPRLLPAGFILFALAQSLMLAKAMAESVGRAELLSGRLLALASDKLALEQQAFRDPLTGLENRRRLDVGMQSLAEQGSGDGGPGASVSLLYLDVDRFKSVNDRFGHEAGDAVLRSVAEILRDEARDSDLSVRMGGDEFVLLLPDTSAEDADRLVARIRSRLQAPIEAGGRKIEVSVSIGRATSRASRVDLPGLLRRADRAMYRKKNAR